MAITPEEAEEIARRILGPTMQDEISDPEKRARLDRAMEEYRAREAKGRPEASEEMAKNWQRWQDSEMRRIRRERGETSE
ncbi:hypothetical protein J2W56_004997 [Nocardia kruczakiae]|uniref:Uncharacterized protein n=1 Tax=Nocardia kruczakiae TaxID=261477 RepID=A0ABU1XL12_9NOCA|nr:hypothetical protein [Nocardia kruczakiae]MDR7171238.1 hypothetical protein [Nocardia kruczakiae]